MVEAHFTSGTLKAYPSLPHGMCTTQADLVPAELLAVMTS
ncbi:hypothetical protein QOZ99_002976 [Angulomicrobium amanitiforme]|uniref:Uncharacterized protein n=1 Tax=Ancylobacter amanitiformis TaxID=217069 RepID=A0ABU0LTN2_9HYPH|nr:hypothetical protein [Ancylobacter amanitiformis]